MSLADKIIDQILIVDLCSEFGIQVESLHGGNFTHRCKCPSPSHKGGRERTPSLYIDSTNNNFYCYGCGAYSNPVNFYNLIHEDLSFQDCVNTLKLRIDDKKGSKRRFVQSNFEIQKEISFLMQFYNGRYPSKQNEFLRIQEKIDCAFQKIGYNDVSAAAKFLGRLRKFLKGKYQ